MSAACSSEPMKRPDAPSTLDLHSPAFLSHARSQLQCLRSALSLPYAFVQQNSEFMESSRAQAEELGNLDICGLKEKWLRQKSDLIKVYTENGFLSSILDEQICNDKKAHEEDQLLLEREHAKISQTALERSQEITSLIESYAKEMTLFQEKVTSIEECLNACTDKSSRLERQQMSQNATDSEEAGLLKNNVEYSEVLLLKDTQELKKKSYETDLEILRVEKEIDWWTTQLEQLQEMDDTWVRVELLKKISEFLDNISIVDFKDGCINLNMKTPLQIENASHANSSILNTFEFVTHRMLINVDQQTFGLQDAKLDPADVPIDDIVCAAKLRGSHSLPDTRNSLEFLRRRIQQRIYMHKSNSGIL